MTVVHGEWCGTKTWPTSCPSCSARVFFFSCNHGSKVFFDELGLPWPIHDCDTYWTRDLKRFTDDNGDTVVELKPGITITRAFATPDSFKVEQNAFSKGQSAKKAKPQGQIEAVEPERELNESHIGVLREITPSMDPLRAFSMKDTAVVRALLGPIGKREMGKITVHVPYHPTEDYIESFTSWIPARLLQDRRIKRGVSVAVDLERIKIMRRGYTWFCNSLEVL